MFNILILIAQGAITYWMWKYWRSTGQSVYGWFLLLNGLFFLDNLFSFFGFRF